MDHPHGQQTLYVGQKAAQTNYYADMQAARIGLPINLRMTLNFSLLGVSPDVATSVFRRMRSTRFTKWVTRPRQGCGPAAAPTDYYGFENRRDNIAYLKIGPDLPHNVHVHWSAHVPLRRQGDFEAVLRGWVAEITKTEDWPENALKIEQLTFGKPATYINKGALPATAERYGVAKDKIREQGLIIGKRTGTSRNIGPARRRADDAKEGIDRRKNHTSRSC
jgi:hypothetical protein